MVCFVSELSWYNLYENDQPMEQVHSFLHPYEKLEEWMFEEAVQVLGPHSATSHKYHQKLNVPSGEQETMSAPNPGVHLDLELTCLCSSFQTSHSHLQDP